jgi:magnesium and cobalt transporter
MSEALSGDGDSRSLLTRLIRRFLRGGEADQSLRAQLEEAIDEHEEDGGHTSANGVAIPRGEIIAIPRSANWDEVIKAFAEHGHSRLPVYADTLDEVVGMMLIKDVFTYLAEGKAPKDWTALMRQPLFVPQARNALDVLNDMRASRTHLAVVVNEYSGTDGIITIEDLVEEITGEIEDEHDDAPTDLLVLLEGGIWEADARAELDDVGERVDVRLSEIEEDVDTLGGLAFVLAGQVPSVGALLAHDSGWHLEVIAGDEKRVTRLRLHPPMPAEVAEG